MKFIGFVIIILYFNVGETTRTANFTKGDNAKLKQFIQDLMDCRRIPGKTICLHLLILLFNKNVEFPELHVCLSVCPK